MSSKIVEAKLVISGEDRASAAIANVVKTFKQMEEAAKVSKPLQDVAKSLLEVEKAERAVGQAMGARGGLNSLQGDLQRAQTALNQTATAFDAARKAKSAYDGVKLVKGSQEAQAAANAAKAVREAGAAHRAAERDVRRMSAAVAAQTTTLAQAERAAAALGAPLSNLEAHQRSLRSTVEQTTTALRSQIRVEEQAARVAHAHAREQEEYNRHMRRHGAINAAATAAAGYVGVHTVGHGVVETLKAGAKYQHEVVALKNSGRTPEELNEIAHASSETIRKVPTATFLENLKVINETTGAFGSVEHAIEHLTFMQKAAAAVHASAGDKIKDDAGEMGNKLARFAEERGSAGDGKKFERESEGLVRAMVFTRGNFNPHEMMNFAQQAKSSLQSYSERFLTGIMPSIVTTMKGERAGTAANSFNSVIDGKVNDKKQAEEWLRYGLLDKSQAVMKAGHAVGWRTGAIKDTALAHSDPLAWMETVVLPALRKKGVDTDDKEALKKVLATMFRNTNANFFANELGQKDMRARLHKDEHLMTSVGSLDEIYQRNLSSDPQEAMKAVTASLENLMTTVSSPAMATAAEGLKSLATGIQSIALAAKEHPNVAMGAGGAAATAGFAASGWLGYKMLTGFGLSTSATALTASAAALDAAAIKLAGGSPPEKLKDAAKAAPAAVGFGLGASTLGVLAGGIFAAYATAKTMPGMVAEKGPGGFDIATGAPTEESPMSGFAPDRPFWSKAEPQLPSMTMAPGGIPLALGAGGARFGLGMGPDAYKTGQDAGEKTGKGIVDSLTEKGVEIVNEGLSIFSRLKAVFSDGIRIPISLGSGDGVGGGSGTGLIHRASLGGGGSGGGGAGGGDGSFGGRALAVGAGAGIGHTASKADRAAYIRQAALARGIDPDTALRVAQSEGFNKYTGDQGRSFGDWQLFTGGGVGNRALAAGIDVRDPSTWKKQTDFALDVAKKEGWGQWHGAGRVGISPWQGLRGKPRAPAAAPGPSIPEGQPNPLDRQLPAGGGMGGAADRMHQAIDRLESIGWQSHHTVEVSASPGLTARTKGMRATATGPVKADVGISMPHINDPDYRGGGGWI